MDRSTEINRVQSDQDIAVVASLADEIWREHYIPIIGQAQVDYMLVKFQSAKAIDQQIKEGAMYYLIVYNHVTIGYLSFYFKEKSLFLSKIYVKSSLRGKGIGKKAIRFIENEARENRLNSISLTVNKNNSRSIEAYQKMGFKITEPVVMDIGGGFVMDDYIMEKQW